MIRTVFDSWNENSNKAYLIDVNDNVYMIECVSDRKVEYYQQISGGWYIIRDDEKIIYVRNLFLDGKKNPNKLRKRLKL